MAAKKRLQELFEKYDLDGDGVLSEEEMLVVFQEIGKPGLAEIAGELFKNNDSNKDGEIQVHEFISWVLGSTAAVTQRKAPEKLEVLITNTSDRVSKCFTFEFSNCESVEMPHGNPSSFVVRPGEQVCKTLLAFQPGQVKYSYRWTARAKFTGSVDDDSKAFKDPDFPHDLSSVGESESRFSLQKRPELWVRARSLGDPSEALLFDQIKPQDIRQGSLADCWLMSAFACLAEQPCRIRKLFKTKHLTEDGRYEIKLFDPVEKEWREVLIDEYLPCVKENEEPTPCFSYPVGEELWVQLLEKAVAKFAGCYGHLSGGSAAWAFMVLTGVMDVVCYWKRDGTWYRRTACCRHGHRGPSSIGWRGWPSDTHETSAVFQLLSEDVAQNYCVTCSIHGGSEEEAKKVGLYSNHEYSLLRAMEEELDDGSRVRFMVLRNPWGMLEWKGDWSDYSELWKKNPKLRERLNATAKNDGRFYITFDDWSKFFTMAVICKDDGGTRRRKEKRCTWTALGRGLQWTALAKDEVEAKEQHESHWAPIGKSLQWISAAKEGGSFTSMASFVAQKDEELEEEEDHIIG